MKAINYRCFTLEEKAAIEVLKRINKTINIIGDKFTMCTR